jgi:hypothetical protein
MLTSPLVITIDGVAHNLSRINNDNFGSVYLKSATGYEYRLTIRHSFEGKAGPGQMERHNVDFVHTVWDAVTGAATIRQVYCVIRTPRGGDSVLTTKDATGFNALVTANLTALMGWES